MEFRIGVNLGDVVVGGDDLLGDGVNVAARLQEVAAPAGICISGAVREQIEGKLDFPLSALGERSLKNIPRPVFIMDLGIGDIFNCRVARNVRNADILGSMEFTCKLGYL